MSGQEMEGSSAEVAREGKNWTFGLWILFAAAI